MEVWRSVDCESSGCSESTGSGGIDSVGGMTDMSGVSAFERTSSAGTTIGVSVLTGERGSSGLSVRTGEVGTLTFTDPFEFASPPSSAIGVAVSDGVTAFGDPVLLLAIDAARRSCNVILPTPTFLLGTSFFAAATAASRATN